MFRSILRNQVCRSQLEKILLTSVTRTQHINNSLSSNFSIASINNFNSSSLLTNNVIDLRSHHNFSTSNINTAKDHEKKPEKTGIVKKFKQMFKDYWYVLVPVHVATSIVWYGGFYIMLKSGVDIVGVLEYFGTSQRILDYLSNSEAGYFALAYACYKIATPVRYTVTVGGTSIAIAKLKDTGYLKSTSEVADKLKDKRDDMKEKYKYEERKDKVEEKIEDFKDRAEEQKDKFKEELDNAWEKFAKKKK